MRRSEALAAVLTRSLGEVKRVLVSGALPDLAGAGKDLQVCDERAAGEADPPFDALLLLADDAVRARLRRLRRRLAPGATVLVVVRGETMSERLFSRWRKQEPREQTLAACCEALLLAGFGAPQRSVSGPGFSVLCAHLPVGLEPLDDVFTQPSAAPAR